MHERDRQDARDTAERARQMHAEALASQGRTAVLMERVRAQRERLIALYPGRFRAKNAKPSK
jgi:hypothetical protein